MQHMGFSVASTSRPVETNRLNVVGADEGEHAEALAH